MVREIAHARALAEKHGATQAYDQVEDLLASPEVDAVYISTPVDLHRDHVIQAAKAGKHVFVEKPMAASVSECRQMIQACRDAGVHLGVAYMMRYRAQCQVARKYIQSGKLGELVMGRAQNTFWYPGDEQAWRQQPERSLGGVLYDVGSHAVDTLRFLMGEVVAVQGFTDSSHFDYEVEDTALGLLKFHSGAVGIIDCSWAVPNRLCLLEIYGTQGSLIVERGLGPFQDPKMRFIHPGGETVIELPLVNAYKAEFEAMSRSILLGRHPEVDGWEGMRITEILVALYRSASRPELVPIPDSKQSAT
jgi:predicted dehydrogenase